MVREVTHPSLILPNLALREATALVARKRWHPEVFDVLDTLANRSGVQIARVDIIVKTNSGSFSLPVAPDRVDELFRAFREMAPEVDDS